jgi:hypothetical protein
MSQYLLTPRVICRNYQLITSTELNQLLKRLKSKKLGLKDYAVDVEEVEKTVPFSRDNDPWTSLKPGMYYNVHLEYMI